MIRRLLVVACLSLVVGVGCQLVLGTEPPDWPEGTDASLADAAPATENGADANGETGGDSDASNGPDGGDEGSSGDGGADGAVAGDGGSETPADAGDDSSDAGDDGPDASSAETDAGADAGADAGNTGTPDAGAPACAGLYESCTDRPCCLGLGCDVTGGAVCQAVLTDGLPNGYACASSGECNDGYCKNRVCTNPDSNGCGGAGWYCSSLTCCSDPKLTCLYPTAPGTCALPSGEPCLYSTMCSSSNCQDGHCGASRRAIGAACTEDLSCVSGHCGADSHLCEACIESSEPCKPDGTGGYIKGACCSGWCLSEGLCE